MPAPTTVPNFFRLKMDILAPAGKISERYDFLSALNTPASVIGPGFWLTYFRQMMLAQGCAIVNASISFQTPTQNTADGLTFPKSALGGNVKIYGIDNSTLETVVAPYANPAQGVRVLFPSGSGRLEKRLFRFIRNTWISNNQFVPTGVTPVNQAGYLAIIGSPPTLPAGPFTIAQIFQVVCGINRDFCAMHKRVGSSFQEVAFSASSPNWAVDGIGNRSVGIGYPPVRGRRRVMA